MKIITVEDALVDRIKTAMPYLRTVESYSGQLDGEIEQMPINYPACFISYERSGIERLDNFAFNETVQFKIFLCSRNLRGQEAMRRGEGGAYQLIGDVLAALTNERLDLDIEPLLPAEISLEYMSKVVAIFSVKFGTSFDDVYPDN